LNPEYNILKTAAFCESGSNKNKKEAAIKYFGKSIDQYDLNGNFIKSWRCISDAAKELNMDISCISTARTSHTHIAGNYLFFDKDSVNTEYVQNFCKNKLYRKKKISDTFGAAKRKPVIQYDLDGHFIKEWPSISSVRKGLKIKSTAGISKCCKTKIGTSAGFKWKYKYEQCE